VQRIKGRVGRHTWAVGTVGEVRNGGRRQSSSDRVSSAGTWHGRRWHALGRNLASRSGRFNDELHCVAGLGPVKSFFNIPNGFPILKYFPNFEI
jgi:hypothetical protein